jgi:hypothetical protein
MVIGKKRSRHKEDHDLQAILAALLVAALTVGAARAEDAAPAEPTAGDRVANSGMTKGLKRASDSIGSGMGGALDAAGRATGRANTAVNRGFDAFDAK